MNNQADNTQGTAKEFRKAANGLGMVPQDSICCETKG